MIDQYTHSRQSMVGTVTHVVIRTVQFSLRDAAPEEIWYSLYN